MVKFTFSVAHGSNKKGAIVEMHQSTAEALEAHKIGTITSEEKEPKAVVRGVTKVGAITAKS
jgi:hypothetical protein